jgi:hypothetical protein
MCKAAPRLIPIIIGFAFIFNSCSDSGPGSIVSHTPDTHGNGNVTVSYTGLRHRLGDDVSLTLDTVKILIIDIKLNVAQSMQERNFKVGPYVLDIVSGASLLTIGTEYIPAGTYDKIKFKLHKLNPNEPVIDPEFVDGQGRYSVVVKGWYNGNHFVFKSDKTAHQMLHFPNSLIVTETSTNITLQITPYVWFQNSSGEYMDPRDPNNRNEIEHNFRDNVNQNFRAFEDDDMNGYPD